jgi:hypothetical protein
MQITDWRSFYHTLAIVPGYGEPVPKPTEAHLDQFEGQSGLRLPRSYRDYIIIFGPGELFADWKIAAPGYAGLADRWDLLQFHAAIQPDGSLLHAYPRGCLTFVDSESGGESPEGIPGRRP